jgi:hypothetical protein
MDITSGESKKVVDSNKESSLAWATIREFLLLTLALSGGFVLIDLYTKGQSIRGYLLQGAFISLFIVLAWHVRERNRRNVKN